jgi:hypothetical protein
MTPKAILDSIGAVRAMPSAPATREPSRNLRSVSALRASVRIASGTVIRPVFTHRVHYGAPNSGPLNIVDSETFYWDLVEASDYAPGAYAHPCDEIPLHVNAKRMAEDLFERVVEDMCEEAHEDAENQVNGGKELREAFEAALDAFNAAQTSCSWMPRAKEVFVIPASVGRNAKRQDAQRLGPQDEHAVPKADAHD